MKLYEAPRNSYVRLMNAVDEAVPPSAPAVQAGEIYHFHHVDGMYSYCTNKHRHTVNMVAWAEVEIVSEKDFKEQTT